MALDVDAVFFPRFRVTNTTKKLVHSSRNQKSECQFSGCGVEIFVTFRSRSHRIDQNWEFKSNNETYLLISLTIKPLSLLLHSIAVCFVVLLFSSNHFDFNVVYWLWFVFSSNIYITLKFLTASCISTMFLFFSDCIELMLLFWWPLEFQIYALKKVILLLIIGWVSWWYSLDCRLNKKHTSYKSIPNILMRIWKNMCRRLERTY